MGLLVDGKWVDRWYDTSASNGRFVRSQSAFRNWVTADGSAGPTGKGGFKAEAGRYHLYVSLACPWAHRTLIMRKLKNLEDRISLSVVHWLMLERGWTFDEGDGVIADPVIDAKQLYDIYVAADPAYTGRVTVPVLWDLKTGTIVNNESAEIMRMLNSAFDDLEDVSPRDFYPVGQREEIDALNDRIYTTVNNGVYRSGFATTQDAYEEAVGPLFDTLDWLDRRLAERRYLTGASVTEADWRLFTTLLRFDSVYFGHFKTNIRRIVDYRHLWPYTRDLYQQDDIRDTVNFRHIKSHYYGSHKAINPTGIVPAGPEIDFAALHERGSSELSGSSQGSAR
jgi:putative glutathione S-transferase